MEVQQNVIPQVYQCGRAEVTFQEEQGYRQVPAGSSGNRLEEKTGFDCTALFYLEKYHAGQHNVLRLYFLIYSREVQKINIAKFVKILTVTQF